MKRILLTFVCLTLVALASGCQGFFEDYNYAPLGSSSGGY